MTRLLAWLPLTAGLFRILVSSKVFVITSTIATAILSNLYILAGLYAIRYALFQLAHLSKKQDELGNAVYLGVFALFVSRGIADLWRYLDLYNKFNVIPELLASPIVSYPPFVQLLAAHLSFFSLSILVVLALYQLYSSTSVKRDTYLQSLKALFNVLFLTVSTLMCLTHAYTFLRLALYPNVYYATVVTPYSATHLSHIFSKIYEPMATAILCVPPRDSSKAEVINI